MNRLAYGLSIILIAPPALAQPAQGTLRQAQGERRQQPADQNRTEEKEAEGGAPAPKVKVERTTTGQKVYRITEGIVVEGRLQKPNAFYVLQRSSIDYDWESLNQGFLPRIIQATGQRPF
jgi:hypothetical protein